ncbi:YihY/virulence factor BrkB family protein [Brevibacterium renqingii]|uniref:YihY/virulence factor BrkB family protein n=1 Tax=Brevibacterium renqingii TaxID=2776916 RepID=UPI001AE0996E|nr:YihY/virulence factor BrkB family protein [Brevibacterium renqingii]
MTALNRMRIVKGALRRLLDDECLDRAAGLSFYALLSAAPAILAMVSLLGVVGEAESTTEAVLSLAHDVSAEAASAIRPIIVELTESSSAGATLIGSLALAIWSSSKYIGAFGRALNTVYRVEETRPYWKFKPLMLLMTVLTLIVLATLGLLLVLSGPIAESLGGLIGMGPAALLIWNVAKWPIFVFFIMLLIALLYYVTPNVKQPRFRWVSLGALIALIALLAVSFGFVLYINNFSNYNVTYGSIGGVIVGLAWVWMVNLALLLGAEFDAEIERERQRVAGDAGEGATRQPTNLTRSQPGRRDDFAPG